VGNRPHPHIPRHTVLDPVHEIRPTDQRGKSGRLPQRPPRRPRTTTTTLRPRWLREAPQQLAIGRAVPRSGLKSGQNADFTALGLHQNNPCASTRRVAFAHSPSSSNPPNTHHLPRWCLFFNHPSPTSPPKPADRRPTDRRLHPTLDRTIRPPPHHLRPTTHRRNLQPQRTLQRPHTLSLQIHRSRRTHTHRNPTARLPPSP